MGNEFRIETIVGPSNVADGNGTQRFRQDRSGALVVSQSRGKYAEAATRGTYFAVSGALTGTTVAAGHVAPPAAAAATTLSVLNPVNSGVNLEITKGMLVHVSGTPGAGAWAWCMVNQGTLITAAEATAIKRSTGSSTTGSKAQAWSAAALTGGAVHVITRVFPTGLFAGAIDGNTNNLSAVDDVDGAIVVKPGWMVTLAPPATGTTHVVVAQIEFIEVPIQG